jgi:hypothetical protein
MGNVTFKSILCLLLLFLIFSGCDKNIESVENPQKLTIAGGLTKNLDINEAAISVSLTSGGITYPDALVRLNNDTLNYDTVSDVYILDYDSAAALAAGNYYLKISQGSFTDSFQFTVPADFGLDSLPIPEDRVNPGGSAVQLDWQVSLNAEGYIFAVTQKDSAYIGAGYSEFVTTGATATNIPPDAFRLSGNLDTGWYYVHVYSYDAAPGYESLLPAAMPYALPNNINFRYLVGKFGSFLVCRPDSIHVTLL